MIRNVTVRDSVEIVGRIRKETGRSYDPVDVFQIVRLVQAGQWTDARLVYGSETLADVYFAIPEDLLEGVDLAGGLR